MLFGEVDLFSSQCFSDDVDSGVVVVVVVVVVDHQIQS